MLSRADVMLPCLSEEESDAIWAVIKPHLQAEEWPTLIASLFGDRVALSFGYSPLGLPDNGGLTFAFNEMQLPVE